jgi:hypothetical protein
VCLVSKFEILTRLDASARLTIDALKRSNSAEVDATARGLETLLDASAPLISPLPVTLPGQITPEVLVGCEVREYPALLEQLIGPPLRVGVEDCLGYVSAECVLAALRQDELQASLSMLFLSTLCASCLEEPAIEALNHMLIGSDATGSIGLFALGVRRTGIGRDEMVRLQQQFGLKFVTTAVQIQGTWGSAGRAMKRAGAFK